ncbi:MAG: FkbM family methyltransferase, partial [Bacteroidota bacterium]
FAPQVAKVVSVEHDKEWYEYLQGQLPSNTSLHFEQLQPDGSYCRKATSTGEQYHMIIVDGRDRVNCCKQAINALAPNGVLLLDDSQREKYQGGLDFMKEQGFKKLDFWGLGPGSIWNKNTTLFYKANNCLNI